MKLKTEWYSDLSPGSGESRQMESAADAELDARAEELLRILQEVEELAEDLSDEQFCAMVHAAANACGFRDALEAWVSLLVVTEKRIAAIDLRDFALPPLDAQN